MNALENATSLLNHFAEVTQIKALELNADNECGVLIDDKIPVLFHLDESGEQLITSIVVGNLSPDNAAANAAILHEMLRGNYCWALTAGGTLAIDPGSDTVTLGHLLTLDDSVTPANWADIMADLLTSAEFWIDKLNATESEITVDPEAIRI